MFNVHVVWHARTINVIHVCIRNNTIESDASMYHRYVHISSKQPRLLSRIEQNSELIIIILTV